MKTTKLLLLLTTLGAAAHAMAQYPSPELILVGDSGGKIDRYDPSSGQYLGSFGQTYLNQPTGLVVVGQDVYVSDTMQLNDGSYASRILKFNFSTGVYGGTIFSASMHAVSGLSKYGGNLLVSDRGNDDGNLGAFHTISPGGTLLDSHLMPTETVAKGIAADATHSYVAAAGVNALYSYNIDTQGVVTGSNFAVGAGRAYNGVATIGNRIFAAGKQDTTGLLVEYDSAGNQIGSYSQDFNIFGPLGVGHNGSLYSLGAIYEGDNRLVYIFDTNTPLFLGPVGRLRLDHTNFGLSVAVYAAPEPFSLATLGLGALVVLRRRRARKTQ